MKISDYFMDAGQLIGTRMKLNSNPATLWWRVLSWEQANYRYIWGTSSANTAGTAIAANAASAGPFNEIQNAQNTYVLMPQQDNFMFHSFVGIWPSNELLYLQYPNMVDRNALAGFRTVDANGQGAIDGYTSQPYNPAPETEIITMPDLRPVYAIWNDSDQSVTPQLYFYTRIYLVEGPYLVGNKAIPDANTLQSYIETGKARVISLYGNNYINVPSRISQSQSLQGAATPSGS